MGSSRPSDEDISVALGRVVQSEAFSRSERARDLLDYLVRTEMAGQSDRLKGFAIALDVFGREADFDPATDAVVRVQAGRLRDLLAQYYDAEGAQDPLRIAVPRGTYVPVYTAGAGAVASADAIDEELELDAGRISATIAARFSEDEMNPRMLRDVRPVIGSPPVPARQFRLIWAGLAAVMAMLAFVTWRVANDLPLAPASVPTGVADRDVRGGATGRMLPLVRLAVQSQGDPSVDKVASLLRTALPVFDSIDFSDQAENGGNPVPDEFIVRVEPAVTQARVVVRIEHAATSVALASTVIDTSADPDVQDAAFTALLNAMFPVSGAVYAFIAEKGTTTPLTKCLEKENRFFLDLRPEDHSAAATCFGDLATQGSKSPLVWAELANLEVAAVTGDIDSQSEATIARATQYARKALELGPNSAAAFRAQGYVLDRSGNTAEGLRWFERAAQINPYDMSLAASAGNNLVLAGQYDTGTRLLSRANRIAPVHPHWWDYAAFLGAFMSDAKEQEWRAADALVDSDRRHYLAARLVAAAERDRLGEARHIAGLLTERDPDFAADPKAAFIKARYAPELAERFAEAIRAALAATGAD